MKGQMLKQKGFVRQLMKSVAEYDENRKEHNERLAALTEDDMDLLVTLFWGTLAGLMRKGKRVVFEGVMSFFTRPVMRKCYNMHAKEDSKRTWFTYALRLRNNVLDNYRDSAETPISEEGYRALKALEQEKKIKK